MSFNFIDSLEDLNFLNNELLSKPFVGVDTEFRRTTKDNMKLALLQVNDAEEIYLIDTILINNPEDSCSFLFSESVTKIFHSCKEDLEAIYKWTGCKAINIFDTQLAEAFLNGKYSISYQELVAKNIGVILEKKETRSNWVKRPLTDAQLRYAASDVEFLLHLYSEQKKALVRTKKLKWHDEELDFLSSKIFLDSDPEEDLVVKLSKAEERVLLDEFNNIVHEYAEKNRINPTMLFSKKNQKHFLRLLMHLGIDKASKEITAWRYNLLKEPLLKLTHSF